MENCTYFSKTPISRSIPLRFSWSPRSPFATYPARTEEFAGFSGGFVAGTIVTLPLKVAEDLVKIINDLVQTQLLSTMERDSVDIAERALAQARKRAERD